MSHNRFDRQISFFGKEGQEKIQNTSVTVVGIGGTGSQLVQQLAYLGVSHFNIIDSDDIEETNRNRLIGARYNDSIPGTRKVDIAKRLVNSIDPTISINLIYNDLRSKASFSEIKKSDYVFGCVDNDGSRLILTELCSAFEKPYFDLATEIFTGDTLIYGGRVFISFDDKGCLMCYGGGLISISEAMADLSSSQERKDYKAIYGVSKKDLSQTGPSVVSINGVVASLAVTEFIVMITELRQPVRLLQYHGQRGIVNNNTDKPNPDCYYCKSIRGIGEKADVDRYCREIRAKTGAK